MFRRHLGALGDPGDITGVCSTPTCRNIDIEIVLTSSVVFLTFLYRPGRSEDLRVVFGRSDLVHKLALALLFGTDGVEDSLAVLALRNVKFAGRLAVSGQNLGLVAAGLAATGEAGGLAHLGLVLDGDGEVRDLAVLHLVTRSWTVVGQNLQRTTTISSLRRGRIGVGG